ncbi:MAG: hypothetical protein Q8Q65_02130 [bacterium]|nr:hypothetical protein [bacterium]
MNEEQLRTSAAVAFTQYQAALPSYERNRLDKGIGWHLIHQIDPDCLVIGCHGGISQEEYAAWSQVVIDNLGDGFKIDSDTSGLYGTVLRSVI